MSWSKRILSAILFGGGLVIAAQQLGTLTTGAIAAMVLGAMLQLDMPLFRRLKA